ncbi:MAG: conjugal transfer protein TrbL, partial [Eggerthellaceae bacterium]|nr:conjugal transfer protein TrbL [Eggerthellaceae bacterium]
LYIMAAFSPIPLSLLALPESRSAGVGYIKNFAAVSLSGLIILILLISFPIILGSIVALTPDTSTPLDTVAAGLTYALQYLAICILLILSLIKSGSWAKNIVGGI